MKRLLLSFSLTVSFAAMTVAAEPLKAVSKSKKSAAAVSPSYYAPEGTPVPLYPGDTNVPPSSPAVPVDPGPLYQPGGSAPQADRAVEKPAVGQKKWEKLLSEPADLDFGDQKTVSVKELLDGLRERHKLSLRLDIPTLSALVGAEHVLNAPKNNSANKRERPQLNVVQPPIQMQSTDRGEGQFRYQLANQTTAPAATAQVVVDADGGKPVPDPIVPVEELPAARADEPTKPDASKLPGKADESPDTHCDDRGTSDEEPEPNLVEQFLSLEVRVETLDLKNASIATVLRQTLDAMPIVFGADFLEMPFPISLSNACLLDYLVEKDGLVITTRMQALSHKETRVYSIRHLRDLKAEELAKIIRQSVRPWSWRSQINDLGDQLRGSFQLPPEVIKSAVTTGVQLAAAQAGATVTISESEPPKLDEKSTTSDAEQLKAIGNATVNGLVTFAHATVLGLEMAHHADFPTGTIATLPGKLIVTQSQAAHREIAELLQQLADE